VLKISGMEGTKWVEKTKVETVMDHLTIYQIPGPETERIGDVFRGGAIF
jgi:hypothetical protein